MRAVGPERGELPRRTPAPGLSAGAIGMGCSRLGAFWQGRSPRAGRTAVAAARAAGIDFFDTADCYARGLSERVLGRALRDDRDSVVICTKVGLLKTPAARIAARRAGAPAGSERCYQAAYVSWAAERSLRRLRTDRLDILLLHSPAPADLEPRAAWPALEALRERGAIKRFGVSCEDAASARVAVGLPGVEVIELPWSPDHPQALDAVRDEARRRGIVILANRVLGQATGDAAAAALRGALAVDGLDIVLVGMSRAEHVASNVAAAAGVPQGERQ